jgi:hypothetical protein
MSEPNETAEEFVKRIHAQRKEILEAFIAKYDCQPEEAVQVRIGNTWKIERMDEAERKRIRSVMLLLEQNKILMQDIAHLLAAIQLNENSPHFRMTPDSWSAYQRLKQWLEHPPEPKNEHE